MAGWKEKLALTAQRNRQEIVAAKLSRREMMRLGLLTAGGSLVVKAGLSSRAFGADNLTDPDGTLARLPPSPPATPFVQPMPILKVKTPVAPNKLTAGLPDPITGKVKLLPPDGTTLIDGATKRIPHQYFKTNPDGTYTDPFGPTKYYELEMKESYGKFHPDYAPSKYWGFDGTVPGPLFRAKYGEPVMIRFHNHLPSVKVKQAFGIAEITTHMHNGHTPSESDGNPVDYFNSCNDPGRSGIDPVTGVLRPLNPYGFKDQHYPNIRAGYTARGDMVGDPAETLGSLWYHDHHLDYTAQNVYKGMFGCYNLFDELDSGDGTGLGLPFGAYDIPIFFNDFLFDSTCQTVYDLFNLDGILGDRFCANGAIQPYLDVKKRRYRFRLYNPGPSRWYEFALWDGTNFLPFWQISTDGNLLPNAVKVNSVRIGVAERADIIVDFADVFAKSKQSTIYLVNRLEQVNGRGPTGRLLSPGTPIVKINLTGAKIADPSTDPSGGGPGPIGIPLRPLPDPDFAALQARAAAAPVRTWRFTRANGQWAVNGKLFDEDVISASIPKESEEVWVIENGGGSWLHPVHIHFEEHRMLSRDGVPVQPAKQFQGAIDYARRDVINLHPSESVRIFMRFRDMKGRYVMHCHNVVHEDHAMMVRWDIV